MSQSRVRDQSFVRDKVVHKETIGKGEGNSHPAKAVTVDTANLTDKEVDNVQKLAEKVSLIDDELTDATQLAETATTNANEATQAVGEHVAGKTNPHATDTTQEFAEVNVTALKSYATEGEVPATDYNWFKSVYATLVDGSIKSWIIGIINFLKQIGLVEPVSEIATFTLALTHLYKGIRCNSVTDIDCNIPLNDTVAFDIGAVITIQQIGNGVVTAKPVSGVTLNGDAKTAGQYKFIQLWKTDTNVWNVIGGVS